MGAILNFDASQVQPAVALEAVPTGWYVGYMSNSEMKPTAANNGAYLEAEFTVLAPHEFAGRKLFDRLNLQNQNPVAVEIANKTLSAICHAVGVLQVPESSVLHNRPLQIKALQKPAGNGADGKFYEASNEIKGYKAVEHAMPQPAPQFAPPPAQQQPVQPQFAPPPVQQPPAPPQFVPPQPAPQQQPPQFAPPPVQQQQPPPVQQFAPPQAQQQPPAPQQFAPPPVQQQAPGGAAIPPWLQNK